MTTVMLRNKATRDFITNLLLSKFYKSEELLLDEALASLLEKKKNLRQEVAIEAYLEEKTSLWGAAEIAGMSLETFKKILVNRGIKMVTS